LFELFEMKERDYLETQSSPFLSCWTRSNSTLIDGWRQRTLL
jgi:hypothetical protein